MTLRTMSREMKKTAPIDMRVARKITQAKVCKNYRKIRAAKKDPFFQAYRKSYIRLP